MPKGIGRLCHWTSDLDGPSADDYSSFGAYQRSLTLKCDEGEPGIITWTPDNDTPDTVYYQCFTHRHLGWKINVLDSCDSAQASEIDEVSVEPDADQDGLLLEASQRYETKIRPNEIFLLQHEKDLIKNHNMNEQPPKIQFDLSKNSEINKIIAEGIKAAEALEESIAKPRENQSSIENDPNQTKTVPLSPTSNPQQTPVYSAPPSKEAPLKKDAVTKPNLALSEYLRPPSVPHGQLFRPVQLPQRRPGAGVVIERRRPANTPYRPYIVPQPSMIINHYKKPISPLIRPFVSQSKPIKAIAPFLVLGQSNDQYPSRKAFEQKINRAPPTIDSSNVQNKNVNRENSAPKFHNKAILDQSVQSTNVAKKKPLREAPPKPYIPKNTFRAPYVITEENLDRQSIPHNSGFQPDSVIVEGGFRPIVKRRMEGDGTEDSDDDDDNSNRRRDDNVAEIDENGDGDALFVNQDAENQQFEPMFIPSPLDSINTSNGKIAVNDKLMENMDVEDGDDKIMMAGERVDAYYLPPDNRKIPGRIYPEGSVVTYDGKAVLDYSLVNPLPPPLPSKNNFLFSSGHLSKTEQLIRNTPQFGPFHGEFPPLAPDFVPPEIVPNPRPTIQNPLPVTEYTNPITTNTNPISTKLTLLKPAAVATEPLKESSVSAVATANGTARNKSP